LSGGEIIYLMCLAVWTQYQRVTDGRMDRQIAISTISLMYECGRVTVTKAQ